jgi:hypothetical protein
MKFHLIFNNKIYNNNLFKLRNNLISSNTLPINKIIKFIIFPIINHNKLKAVHYNHIEMQKTLYFILETDKIRLI